MRICFLSNAANYHTQKWANWFVGRGHEIHVISFINAEIPGVKVHYVENSVNPNGGNVGKLRYLTHSKKIRRILQEINPDIINVHYATSYGVAAALAGIHPYILSVWGSDIYDFPNCSPLHRQLLKYSLRSADRLFSTSKAMAEEAAKYTEKSFDVTPFGVNMDLFNPDKRDRNDSRFVIGTVKSLTPKYGIDTFLKAASIVNSEHPDYNLEVRIAGKGMAENDLKELSQKLKLNNVVTWLGFISQENAAKEWANMDIAIIPSTLESFGVSAVEAEASGTPVIISDVPGLEEATKAGVTSLVVPRKNERALAEAIIKLHDDEELRKQMGAAGREFVSENYEINKCFENVEYVFRFLKNNL